MDSMSNLTPREVNLIQEIGLLQRHRELYQLVVTSLITRLGGSVALSQEELEHVRDTYSLEEQSKVHNGKGDLVYSVRLK